MASTNPALIHAYRSIWQRVRNFPGVEVWVGPFQREVLVSLDYYRRIAPEQPVSLADVLNRIESRAIASPAQFLHTLRLVFLNALRFFATVDEGFRGTAISCLRLLDDVILATPSFLAELPRFTRVSDSFPQWGVAERTLDRLLAARRQSDKEQAVRNFVFPVASYFPDGDFPEDYFRHVQSPTCLADVSAKLYGGEYASLGAFAAHVRAVFGNAIKYYRDENEYGAEAQACLNMFETILEKQLAKEGTAGGGPALPAPVAVERGAQRRAPAAGPVAAPLESAPAVARRPPLPAPSPPRPPHLSAKEVTLLTQALHAAGETFHLSTVTGQPLTLANTFEWPAESLISTVPQYAERVRNPIDLKKIRAKLAHTGAYPTPTSLSADVLLMVNNCISFNAGDSVAGLDYQAAANEFWGVFSAAFAAKLPGHALAIEPASYSEPGIVLPPPKEKKAPRGAAAAAAAAGGGLIAAAALPPPVVETELQQGKGFAAAAAASVPSYGDSSTGVGALPSSSPSTSYAAGGESQPPAAPPAPAPRLKLKLGLSQRPLGSEPSPPSDGATAPSSMLGAHSGSASAAPAPSPDPWAPRASLGEAPAATLGGGDWRSHAAAASVAFAPPTPSPAAPPQKQQNQQRQEKQQHAAPRPKAVAFAEPPPPRSIDAAAAAAVVATTPAPAPKPRQRNTSSSSSAPASGGAAVIDLISEAGGGGGAPAPVDSVISGPLYPLHEIVLDTDYDLQKFVIDGLLSRLVKHPYSSSFLEPFLSEEGANRLRPFYVAIAASRPEVVEVAYGLTRIWRVFFKDNRYPMVGHLDDDINRLFDLSVIIHSAPAWYNVAGRTDLAIAAKDLIARAKRLKAYWHALMVEFLGALTDGRHTVLQRERAPALEARNALILPSPIHPSTVPDVLKTLTFCGKGPCKRYFSRPPHEIWPDLGPAYYSQIDNHPMDLRTIRTKLEAGGYAFYADVKADVWLIASNALKVNALAPQGSEGAKVAEAARGITVSWDWDWADRSIDIEDKLAVAAISGERDAGLKAIRDEREGFARAALQAAQTAAEHRRLSMTADGVIASAMGALEADDPGALGSGEVWSFGAGGLGTSVLGGTLPELDPTQPQFSFALVADYYRGEVSRAAGNRAVYEASCGGGGGGGGGGDRGPAAASPALREAVARMLASAVASAAPALEGAAHGALAAGERAAAESVGRASAPMEEEGGGGGSVAAATAADVASAPQAVGVNTASGRPGLWGEAGGSDGTWGEGSSTSSSGVIADAAAVPAPAAASRAAAPGTGVSSGGWAKNDGSSVWTDVPAVSSSGSSSSSGSGGGAPRFQPVALGFSVAQSKRTAAFAAPLGGGMAPGAKRGRAVSSAPPAAAVAIAMQWEVEE